jgi:glycosyltransferase involved in cell wall biosynthesis
MKILMTADGLGGVWNYALELARGLQPYGCFVHLVVFGGKLSNVQRVELSLCENVCCTESDLRLEWMDDPWEDQQVAADLILEIANEVKPDVIHFNGYALASRADWRIPVIIGAHSCVLSWWNAVKRQPAPSRFGHYRNEVAAGLAAADAVVAPTQALLSVIEEIYQVDFHGLVIRNGVDPKPFRACHKVGQIFSVGRVWDEAKNIALLDSIAPEVAWPILIAGEAASPISDCRSSFSHVRVLGKLSHWAVCEEMSRTAIYAAPAWYEPFGLAVLEAALSRCALILADIPTFRELWQDAAMLVEPSDARCWKATLSKVLEDGPARRALAEAARKRALALNRELMSSAYYHLYCELAKFQPSEAQSAA